MRIVQKIALLTVVLASFLPAQAQIRTRTMRSGRSGAYNLESILTQQAITNQIEFLADTLCQGRAMESPGGSEAAFWLSRQFDFYGVKPMGETFVHSFSTGTKVGHNVLGVVPGTSGRYIIVAAHYDGLGLLDGSFYPGADSNASGVVAMLQLSHLFESRTPFIPLEVGIIFVALDGKQFSMAGAQALYDEIASGALRDPISGRSLSRKDIDLMVNLDILGSTLEPVHKGVPNFLIMLGGESYRRDLLRMVNRTLDEEMDLSFDYYGSKDFTEIFYNRISDQKVFVEHGIPSVMFTSGITMLTNKQDDTLESLDIEVLHRRIVLIYRWLERQI